MSDTTAQRLTAVLAAEPARASEPPPTLAFTSPERLSIAPLIAGTLAVALRELLERAQVPRTQLLLAGAWSAVLAWILLWRRRPRPLHEVVGLEPGEFLSVDTGTVEGFRLHWQAESLEPTGRKRRGASGLEWEVTTPLGTGWVAADHLAPMGT